MVRPKRFLLCAIAAVVLASTVVGSVLFVVGCGGSEPTTTTTTLGIREVVLAPGENWAITESEELDSLTVSEGSTITPPQGKSVTLTVDGVEQGQALATTTGYDLSFVPSVYVGEVILTLTDANPVEYTPTGANGDSELPVVQPFRQAICVDLAGYTEYKSVLAAISGAEPTLEVAEGLSIRSTGECFSGVFAASSYTLKNVEIDLLGNGRSDLSGYGAGVVGTGQGTTLVLDGVNITNQGVVRAGVVARDGANLIVKNSELQTGDGELPIDYTPTVDTEQMRSAPWMLGLSGNARAVNVLGVGTKASFINSSIASEGWGVLSTESCVTPTIAAVNAQLSINGGDGYGSYACGGATQHFLGCDLNVASYATISRGASLYYGDSASEKVAQLNSTLRMGLSADELSAIPDQGTMVTSMRFGVMWHGGGEIGDAGTLDISGATVFNTREAVFLDKGQAVKINVDGMDGAALNPENGIIMQLMDDDDPGVDPLTLAMNGVYEEPTTPPEVDPQHDLTRVVEGQDVLVNFKNIELTGDLFNALRGGAIPLPTGAWGGGVGATTTTLARKPGAPTTAGASTTTIASTTTTTLAPSDGTTTTTETAEETISASKNLGLTLDNAKLTGIVSSSTASHSKPTITAVDYRLLGVVTNTPAEAINNGVAVVLTNGSVWTVAGTSYLTSLTFDEDSSLVAPDGRELTLKVNGKEKKLTAGTYTGKIELIVE